jgi:hypothetical protein
MKRKKSMQSTFALQELHKKHRTAFRRNMLQRLFFIGKNRITAADYFSCL